MEPDEGIILQGAERILHGQTPYRDFFSFYTPGSYYLTAAVLRLLGDSLATARTVLAAGASLMSALTYLLARRASSRAISLGVALLTTLTALPYRYLVLHNWDSTFWAMLALYMAARYLETPRRTSAFALGSMAAITVLFEQSKGAGLVVGLGLGFAAVAIARRVGAVEGRGFSPAVATRQPEWATSESAMIIGAEASPFLSNLAPLAIGFGWPFLAVFAWFAHQHALAPMLRDGLWPLHHYSHVNSVPYGYQSWSEASREILFGNPSWGHRLLALLVLIPCFLVPVLPLVAAAVFVRLTYRAISDRADRRSGGARRAAPEGAPGIPWRRSSSRVPRAGLSAPPPGRAHINRANWPGLGGGAESPPLSNRAKRFSPRAARASFHSGQDARAPREYYLLVSGVITGLLLFSVVAVRADIIHFMYLAPMLYVVLAWVLDGRGVPSPLFHTLLPGLRVLIVVSFGLFASALAVRGLTARLPTETRRGTIKASAPDEVLSSIESQIPAGSTIFIYPYLPLYYYLTGTFAPGAHDYLQPGMHTPEQAAEELHSLEADRTAVALYEYAFDEKVASSWPRTPPEAIARDSVADFLLSHYHTCGVLKSAAGWRFFFMVRKDLSCPPWISKPNGLLKNQANLSLTEAKNQLVRLVGISVCQLPE